ncbi:hypothetical protein [Labilibaculum sp.]|uniref:hypothetical protein n=1 Tax=Labilibaculum sp. TaxID=2060723 RepID=UPI003562BA2B
MTRKIRIQFALVLVVLLLPISLLAQENDMRLSIGIPLGKYGKFDHNFGSADESNSPSFIVQLEKNWKPDFSMGAYIGYSGQKQEFSSSEIKYKYYRFGAVLTYELNNWLSDRNIAPANGIEMYASLKTGLSLENKKSVSSNLDSSNVQIFSSNKDNDLLIDLGVLLGSRYHFTDQFGIFGELGWGNAGFFTIGTTFTL